MIKIEIISNEKYTFDFDIKVLSMKIANSIFNEEKLQYSFSFNLFFVSKQKIKTINKQNRNVDKVTDVLSFPNIAFDRPSNLRKYVKNRKIDFEIYDYTTKTIFLGDILICYDVLKKQAKLYAHSIKREFSFLLTHALFHLLGYDHMNEKDEKKMFNKQELILNELKIYR